MKKIPLEQQFQHTSSNPTRDIGAIMTMIRDAHQSPEEQVAILRKQSNSFVFLRYLRIAYDNDVVFTLPKGVPPYKKKNLPEGMADTNLYQVARVLNLFIAPANQPIPVKTNISAGRKEAEYIKILETLSSVDQEFFLALKDKIVHHVYLLSFDTLKTAFPEFGKLRNPLTEKPTAGFQSKENKEETPSSNGGSKEEQSSDETFSEHQEVPPTTPPTPRTSQTRRAKKND